MIEMAQQRIVRLDHVEVNRICVGEDHQPMAGAQVGQEGLLDQWFGQENAGPQIAEIVVGDVQFELGGKFPDELLGADVAALEARHQAGIAHALRDLGDRVIAKGLQLRIGEPEIEGDDDVAEVEEDGFYHYF